MSPPLLSMGSTDRPSEPSSSRCRGRVRRRGPDWAIVHTTATVGPVDVITVCGFRCASATRTILDLAAAGADPDRLAAALDSAMRLHLSAPLVLVERLSELRGPGRYGVRLSTPATRQRRRNDAGTPLPGARPPRRAPQDRRRSAGSAATVLTWPESTSSYADLRIWSRCSGRLGHSNPADRSRDAQRRNELQDLGCAVYEYTWGAKSAVPSTSPTHCAIDYSATAVCAEETRVGPLGHTSEVVSDRAAGDSHRPVRAQQERGKVPGEVGEGQHLGVQVDAERLDDEAPASLDAGPGVWV